MLIVVINYVVTTAAERRVGSFTSTYFSFYLTSLSQMLSYSISISTLTHPNPSTLWKSSAFSWPKSWLGPTAPDVSLAVVADPHALSNSSTFLSKTAHSHQPRGADVAGVSTAPSTPTRGRTALEDVENVEFGSAMMATPDCFYLWHKNL